MHFRPKDERPLFVTFDRDHQVELARGRMKPTVTMVARYLGTKSGELKHRYNTALVEGTPTGRIRDEIDIIAGLLDVLKNSDE
jgi:hypothetical protein